MALLLRKQRILFSSITKSFARTLHKSTTTDEVHYDVITECTDELLLKTQLRWEMQRKKRNEAIVQQPISALKEVGNFIDSTERTGEKSVSDIMILSVDFGKLNEDHIDHLVLVACRDKNNEFIEKFIHECVDHNKVISEKSVLAVLEYFCTFSDNRMLSKVIELCNLTNKRIYEENCEFKHFIARNFWQRGNSDGALSLLDGIYAQANTTVKTKIRSIFLFIVEDTVSNKSEAVLVRLVKSAVFLKERQNEPAILFHIWKVCFFSNCRGIISYNALCAGQVDAVHRLIQMFLKFEMKNECKLIFELLFDYQYACKNLRGCSEIMKTSLELDINLREVYNLKLLSLLMGGERIRPATKPGKHVIKEFGFKF